MGITVYPNNFLKLAIIEIPSGYKTMVTTLIYTSLYPPSNQNTEIKATWCLSVCPSGIGKRHEIIANVHMYVPSKDTWNGCETWKTCGIGTET